MLPKDPLRRPPRSKAFHLAILYASSASHHAALLDRLPWDFLFPLEVFWNIWHIKPLGLHQQTLHSEYTHLKQCSTEREGREPGVLSQNLGSFGGGDPAEFSAFSSAVKKGDFQAFQARSGISAQFKGVLA